MDAQVAFPFIVLLWLGWAVLSVWGTRFVLKWWVFRFQPDWESYAACNAAMIALGFAAMAFVDASGWHLKASNNLPMQKAGAIVLFLSPFGLTLWIGGPIVLLNDLIKAWRRSEGYIA